MTTEQIRNAYGIRSHEYVEKLGSVGDMSPEDKSVIEEWGHSVVGSLVDAGSGPGHWTEYLRECGADVVGVDVVPEFVASARQRFPKSRYRRGTLDELPAGNGELGGVLAWYSLIHTPPADVAVVLGEFARVLRPGGSLLLGVFEGPHAVAFDHAVVTAYFWSVDALRSALETAGFAIQEVHTRHDPGARPHAAIVAKRNR
ncbi:class I SAM-dependent methyltransferase [Haloglycomyces albus]|uniref:class I SAM-dependent methyltransferase n=1 Tax=Haloglycomyces albus TaxID=526067 RepID=UPI00046C8BC6|nr:class I SAM-dependent methyltransferase [Haloglycomyces albus]